MGLSRNHRNRRKKRAATGAGRRLLLRACWVLGIGLGTLALLRFEQSLPENSSMGLHLDPHTLSELHRAKPAQPAGPASGAGNSGAGSGQQTHVSKASHTHARPSAAMRSWLRHPSLRLERVVFFGLNRVDEAAVTRELELSSEIALVDLSPNVLCDRLRALGRFSRCAALRLPPSTLAVAVREREPIAMIDETGQGVARDGSRFELLGDEGRRLPRIIGDVQRALPYVDAARWAAIPISRIEARSQDAARPHFTAWVRDPELRLLLGDDPIRTFLRYRALAGADVLAADAEGALELDLRFRGNVFLRKIADSDAVNEGKAA